MKLTDDIHDFFKWGTTWGTALIGAFLAAWAAVPEFHQALSPHTAAWITFAAVLVKQLLVRTVDFTSKRKSK